MVQTAHVSPDSSRWTNVLILTELWFNLPFSNGSVDRAFSTMEFIKTNHRTRLQRDTLSDKMAVKVEGPSLNTFSSKQAVETWWRDCKTLRKSNQSARKQFSPGDTGADEESDSEDKMHTSLSQWDACFSKTQSSTSTNSD